MDCHDLSGCRHPTSPDSCDEFCACWCDACQERYEAKWAEDTAREGLCVACGVPKGDLTMASLERTRANHFYLPCPDCAARFKECFTAAGLCEACRAPRASFDVPCPNCTCLKKTPSDTTTACSCIQCRYARVSAIGAASLKKETAAATTEHSNEPCPCKECEKSRGSTQ